MIKKYSIIVCAYNIEKYLKSCIDSIINQDFDFNLVQLIIADDGSLDNTSKIGQEYASKFDFIEYYFKPRNEDSGIGNLRNFALEKVVGKYFWFIDGDDTLATSDALKIIDKNFTKYPETNLLIFDYKRVYEKQTLIQKIYQPNSKQEFSYGHLNSLQAQKISHAPWNKIWSSKKYKNIKFDNVIYEDVLLTKYMFLENKILVIEECLYNYVVKNNSIMTQKYNKNKVTQNIVNYLNLEKQIPKEYQREFYYRFLKYGYIYSLYVLNKAKKDQELLKKYAQEANHYIKKYKLQSCLSFVEKMFMFIISIKSNLIKEK